MAWFCFLDWIEVVGTRVGAPVSLSLGSSPRSVLRDFSETAGSDTSVMNCACLDILNAMSARLEAARIGARIDPSGLVTLAVSMPDPAIDDDEGRRAAHRHARLAALLVVDFLARCLSGRDRLPKQVTSDGGIVVPTMALWPLEVEPSTTRTKDEPEQAVAVLVMRRALKGTLKSLGIARDAPGWTPELSESRPALEMLVRRVLSTIQWHEKRMDGSLREQTHVRIAHLRIRSSETLLRRLFRDVTLNTLALLLLWFVLIMLGTWLQPWRLPWLSLSMTDLAIWTLGLNAAAFLLVLSTFSTSASRDDGTRRVGWLFQRRWHLWTPFMLLFAAAVFLALDTTIVEAKLGHLFANVDKSTSVESLDGREAPAGYLKALMNLVWVLPAPLLIALLQAGSTFGRAVTSESKLQRQQLLVSRLQDQVREVKSASTALCAVVDQRKSASPLREAIPSDEHLKTHIEALGRSETGFKDQLAGALKRFEVGTSFAAISALLVTVLQYIAGLKPTSLVTTKDEPYVVVEAGCLGELDPTEANDADRAQTVLLQRILECQDMAQERAAKAEAEAAAKAEAEAAPAASGQLEGTEPKPNWIPQYLGTEACPGPRVSSCSQGDVRTALADVRALRTELSALSGQIAVFQGMLPVKAFLDRTQLSADLAELENNFPIVKIGVELDTSRLDGAIQAVKDQLRTIPDMEVTVRIDDSDLPDRIASIEQRIRAISDAIIELRVIGTEVGTGSALPSDSACRHLREYRFTYNSSVVSPVAKGREGWFVGDELVDIDVVRDRIADVRTTGSGIYVFGSADPRGPDVFNHRLAEERAQAVAEALSSGAGPKPIPLGLGSNAWLIGIGLPVSMEDAEYRAAHVFECERDLIDFARMEDDR